MGKPAQRLSQEQIAEAKASKRRLRALDLRIAGKTIRQIATATDVSIAQAHADVTAALDEVRALEVGKAQELRALELERLDLAVLALMPKIRLRGKDLLGAVDRLVRVSERRARLCGLDMPVKTAITDPTGEIPYDGPEALAALDIQLSQMSARADEPEAEEASALPSPSDDEGDAS